MKRKTKRKPPPPPKETLADVQRDTDSFAMFAKLLLSLAPVTVPGGPKLPPKSKR